MGKSLWMDGGISSNTAVCMSDVTGICHMNTFTLLNTIKSVCFMRLAEEDQEENP